jgi:hypothetical protein
MRQTTGTLADLTVAFNDTLAELGAVTVAADGSLLSLTTQLNAFLVEVASPLGPADGTLIGDSTTYNLYVTTYPFTALVDTHAVGSIQDLTVGAHPALTIRRL